MSGLISIKKTDFIRFIRELNMERINILEMPDHENDLIIAVGRKRFEEIKEHISDESFRHPKTKG